MVIILSIVLNPGFQMYGEPDKAALSHANRRHRAKGEILDNSPMVRQQVLLLRESAVKPTRI
jgi:hypothetical protein